MERLKMANNTTNITDITTETARAVADEILLAVHFLTMLLGALAGALGLVSLCRRYKHTRPTHFFFYHILLLELILSLVVVNSRAYIILYGTIPEMSCQIITLTENALNCCAMYTLMLNMLDTNYRMKHAEYAGLFGSSKKGNFLCAFFGLWLWSAAVIVAPSASPLTIEYHEPEFQCLWNTAAGVTWYYMVACVLGAALGLPFLITLIASFKFCHNNRTSPNNKIQPVTPVIEVKSAKNEGFEKQFVKDSSKSYERPVIAGLILHTILRMAGYTALYVLLLTDANLGVSVNVYSYLVAGARFCSVAGLYLHILSDKSLRKHLSIGTKCST